MHSGQLPKGMTRGSPAYCKKLVFREFLLCFNPPTTFQKFSSEFVGILTMTYSRRITRNRHFQVICLLILRKNIRPQRSSMVPSKVEVVWMTAENFIYRRFLVQAIQIKFSFSLGIRNRVKKLKKRNLIRDPK